jgi:hypothetical protein
MRTGPSPLSGLLLGLLVLVAVASVAVAIAASWTGGSAPAPAPTQQVVAAPSDDGISGGDGTATGTGTGSATAGGEPATGELRPRRARRGLRGGPAGADRAHLRRGQGAPARAFGLRPVLALHRQAGVLALCGPPAVVAESELTLQRLGRRRAAIQAEGFG